jgi:iron complex outermembrane receptor protein
MRTIRFLSTIILSLCVQFLFAQQKITGKVTDASKGTPIEGASVTIKSSGEGTQTDNNGMFTITAKGNDVLEVSYIGYTFISVAVNGRTNIDIPMEPVTAVLGEIVTVGTRSGGRIKTETPVPVDVLNTAQLAMPTARMDLTSVLNFAAPSFNYNKQSGSDGADHVDLATLRGLGPDQTLVLINGKRRHQTAFVAVFGTRGRGNSGTDLNTIPVGAIDRVEILRDGASAQYGSDAIAGVINLVLKRDVKKFTMNIGYSGYVDPKYNTYNPKNNGQYPYQSAIDGNTFTANANYGLPIGKNGGFINLSGSFSSAGKTFRQILDTTNFLHSKDAMYYNYVRRAYGDGSLLSGGGFLNMEIPFAGTRTSFYAFGGYNYKKSDSYAFTRSWKGKPNRFPTDANGNLIYVPAIMYSVYNSDGTYDTVYNPHIQTHIQDASLAAGVRGTLGSNWDWDLSNVIGDNNFHFYGDKTFNASLGTTRNHFDDGGFNFLQNTSNLNFSKKIGGNFNLALGSEFRYERYKIKAGEEASYKNYNPDKAGGSQGFPGYQPSDEVNAHRNTIALYVDAEWDVTKALLLGGAVRAEHYSDFGFTTNYKLDARLKLTPTFNVRGSISAGFRAPSLQQINFSSTFTNVLGGTIAEVKIAPNYSPITKAAGIPELKQEKSVNASFGFVWRPSRDFTITVDGYWVKINDRVVLSGQFSADDPTLDTALTNTLKRLTVSQAQFFANAVNTTNIGVDMVFDYNKHFNNQHFRTLLTGNVQHMKIDKINVPEKLNDTKEHRDNFLSDREQKFILASAPPAKFSLNIEYGIDKFTAGTRFTYFGKIDLYGYGEDGLGIDPKVPTDADPNVYVQDEYIYHGKVVSDIYFSYKIWKHADLYIGADNIFNVHPDYGIVQNAKYWAFNNESGGPWDAVQMGSNGMRVFARLAFNF